MISPHVAGALSPRLSLRRVLLLLVTSLLLSAGLARAGEAFTVEVDTSKAPECAAFAAKSEALVKEWYPRINDLLFGKDHALPYPIVRLIFEPMKGVAHTMKADLHISAEWVTQKAPNDYGMVIHELTHVVQDYRAKGEFWVTEGIADYIRYFQFEPGAKTFRPIPEKSRYQQGYGTSAAFLAWLEKEKCPGIVRKLNAASHDGQYRLELFQQLCGADLETLWQEYVRAQSR